LIIIKKKIPTAHLPHVRSVYRTHRCGIPVPDVSVSFSSLSLPSLCTCIFPLNCAISVSPLSISLCTHKHTQTPFFVSTRSSLPFVIVVYLSPHATDRTENHQSHDNLALVEQVASQSEKHPSFLVVTLQRRLCTFGDESALHCICTAHKKQKTTALHLHCTQKTGLHCTGLHCTQKTNMHQIRSNAYITLNLCMCV
jgi:hypothetical protein